MNKLIIINYIKKLTKQDIYKYCVNNNIPINDEEVDVIYYYIKNRYNEFFEGHELELLEEQLHYMRGYLRCLNCRLEQYNSNS